MLLRPDPIDFEMCPECGLVDPYSQDDECAWIGTPVTPPEWAPWGAEAHMIECRECCRSEIIVTLPVLPADAGCLGAERVLRAVYVWCAMAAACRRTSQMTCDRHEDSAEPVWS